MLKFPRYPLAELLKREGNNLDLIRVVCACLVIFGHAAGVVDDPRHSFGDPISGWLKYDGVYAGSMAVRVFFFISGLLVTDSLLRKKSVAGFIIGRIFRVWPALIALLVLTVFVVGPLFSHYASADFFTHRATYRYLRENLLLVTSSYLPGVFELNPHPRQINASLWTLSNEIGCYAALLVLFVFRITARWWLCAIVVAIAYLEPLLPHSLFFPGLDDNWQVRYLPSAFALGGLFALFKDRITLGPESIIVLGLLFFPLKSTLVGQHLFFATLFLALLYVSGLPAVRKIKLGADLSYGTYLWGFLVQQIVASQFAGLGFGFNLLTSLVLSLLLAFLSWHLVEKHAIALGHRWAEALRRERAGSQASVTPAPPQTASS